MIEKLNDCSLNIFIAAKTLPQTMDAIYAVQKTYCDLEEQAKDQKLNRVRGKVKGEEVQIIWNEYPEYMQKIIKKVEELNTDLLTLMESKKLKYIINNKVETVLKKNDDYTRITPENGKKTINHFIERIKLQIQENERNLNS